MTTTASGFRPWHAPEPRPACCPVRQPVLQTAGLGVSFQGQPVLREVSLDMHRGCITAVVGPSGCGKSTFLASLNRMLDLHDGVAVSGDVRFEGESILGNEVDTLRLRRRIGLIAQRPNPFPLSIRRNLAFPLREHGVCDRVEQDARIEASLRQVGLWQEVRQRLERPALDLSGGQQQRLCLARALALEPEVLLLDEPCSALDPIASGIVEDLIAGLRGRYTVVIVTHNLAQARRIADDMAVFWTSDGVGRLVESGNADRLFVEPRREITRAYIAGARG